MQIYEKIVIYNSISELNFRAKKTPKMPYEKKTNFATLFYDYFNKIIHIFAVSKGP